MIKEEGRRKKGQREDRNQMEKMREERERKINDRRGEKRQGALDNVPFPKVGLREGEARRMAVLSGVPKVTCIQHRATAYANWPWVTCFAVGTPPALLDLCAGDPNCSTAGWRGHRRAGVARSVRLCHC